MDLKFFKNLNEATLYLLLPIGLTCILSGLLYINEISLKNSWLINRVTDVPFVMIFILYIYSSFKTKQLRDTKIEPKKFNQILEFTTVIALILIIFIFDITLPNQIPN